MKLDNTNSKNSKPGYTVPKDYFNNLEDRIMKRVSSNSEESIPKQSGFTVPSDYFENFNQKLISNIEKEESKVIHLPSRIKKQFILTATVAAAAILLYFGFFTQDNSGTAISTDMVETYFIESELDSYELAELLLETEFIKLEDLNVESTVDASDLESYLLNNADVETIIDQ